MTTLPAQSC